MEENARRDAKDALARQREHSQNVRELETEISQLESSLKNAEKAYQKALDQSRASLNDGIKTEVKNLATGNKDKAAKVEAAKDAAEAIKSYGDAQDAQMRLIVVPEQIAKTRDRLATEQTLMKQAEMQSEGASKISVAAKNQRVKVEKEQARRAKEAAQKKQQKERELREMREAIRDATRRSMEKSIERQQRETRDFNDSIGQDDHGNTRS